MLGGLSVVCNAAPMPWVLPALLVCKDEPVYKRRPNIRWQLPVPIVERD